MTDVFTPQISTVLEGYCQQSRQAATKVPLYYLSLIFNGLVTVGVMLFEYEILYRVFSYLAGDDNEFWSPEVMGLTSLILVVAFHYLTDQNKDHPAVRFINKVSWIMSLVYLIGIGLLLALLIFADASGLFDPDTLGVTVEGTEDEASMVAALMANITSPIAKLLLSFGIGALAITNVFVAHHAISKARAAMSHITTYRDKWQQDKQDMAAYRAAKQAYREIEQQKQDHEIASHDTLQNEVVADVLLAISEALAPILVHINNALFMNTLSGTLPESQLNAEQMQKSG